MPAPSPTMAALLLQSPGSAGGRRRRGGVGVFVEGARWGLQEAGTSRTVPMYSCSRPCRLAGNGQRLDFDLDDESNLDEGRAWRRARPRNTEAVAEQRSLSVSSESGVGAEADAHPDLPRFAGFRRGTGRLLITRRKTGARALGARWRPSLHARGEARWGQQIPWRHPGGGESLRLCGRREQKEDHRRACSEVSRAGRNSPARHRGRTSPAEPSLRLWLACYFGRYSGSGTISQSGIERSSRRRR